MKIQILCLVAFVVMVSAERYTDKYDNINLDEILNNKRLLLPYLKCINDEGKCTPDGQELKIHVKEAMQEECAKCTEFQKQNSRKVLAKVINEEPEFWKKMKGKYDSEDAFSSKYEKELKKN